MIRGATPESRRLGRHDDEVIGLPPAERCGRKRRGTLPLPKTKVFGSRRCPVRPQYRWNFASRYHIYLLLKAIQPYLVVKTREAKRAISYFENLGWKTDEVNETGCHKDWRDANRSSGRRTDAEGARSFGGGDSALREGPRQRRDANRIGGPDLLRIV